MLIRDSEYRQLLKQREEMLRIIGVLVARAGGAVTILPEELGVDRQVAREQIAFTGAIVVTATAA